MAANYDQWRDTVLEIIKTQPDGCAQEYLEAALAKVDGIPSEEGAVGEIISDGLNWLLTKGFVELLQQADGSLLYRELDPETATKLRGLSAEEQAAYNKIKEAKDQGIWTRELKKVLRITQQQKFDKMMKKLTERHLIKTVKGVAGNKKNRLMYMLFELEPSADLSGGPWYTASGDFNVELIDHLKEKAYEFILEKQTCDLTAIVSHIQVAGVSPVELQKEHILNIVDVLVLDGRVERTSGVTVQYRAERLPPRSSALTDIPCGICTVQKSCAPGGIVSPQECQYLKEWLEPLTD